jgi:hypothetical protein
VRFREERRMFGFLVTTCAARRRLDMATPASAWSRSHGGATTAVCSCRGRAVRRSVPRESEAPIFVRESAAPAPSDAHAPNEVRGPLVQVAKTYILRALSDGFEIVDQHALHERLTLELCTQSSTRGGIECSAGSCRSWSKVGAAAAEALEPHLEALARIGFVLARSARARSPCTVCRRVCATGRRHDRAEVLASIEAPARRPARASCSKRCCTARPAARR